MFMTCADLKKNREVIRTFCAQNRAGLTVVGSILARDLRMSSYEDYAKFSNDLTLDEFVGNYLANLMRPSAIDEYKKVNDGELGFYSFVEKTMGKNIRMELEERMEAL